MWLLAQNNEIKVVDVVQENACEKTSSAMEKLLESVKISDSNFQVNIVDDTDNSIVLYSATNGETTLNELK